MFDLAANRFSAIQASDLTYTRDKRSHLKLKINYNSVFLYPIATKSES